MTSLEAIRERRTPSFTKEDERLVYDITVELNSTRSLSEANYNRGLRILGEKPLIELVSAIGFYAMGDYRPGPSSGPPQIVLGFGNLTDSAIGRGIEAVADLL